MEKSTNKKYILLLRLQWVIFRYGYWRNYLTYFLVYYSICFVTLPDPLIDVHCSTKGVGAWGGRGQRYWSRESLHIFLFKGFQFFSVVYLGNIYARFFPPGNIQMWIFTQDIARHAPFLINPPEYRKILAMLLSPSINRYMCFIPKITRNQFLQQNMGNWAYRRLILL